MPDILERLGLFLVKGCAGRQPKNCGGRDFPDANIEQRRQIAVFCEALVHPQVMHV
jgi:hypothetical protein